MTTKWNRSLFRSLDRLIEILKISEDLVTIQYVLNIIILFFSSREGVHKEYEYFENSVPQLLNLIKIYMLHKNINSKFEVNLCEFFRDDPGY